MDTKKIVTNGRISIMLIKNILYLLKQELMEQIRCAYKLAATT